MIEIRYSPQSGIDISGSYTELQNIKEQIERLVATQARAFTIEANLNADPQSYDKTLSRVTIEAGEGPTKVTVINGNEVYISGAGENLDVFASFLSFDAESPSGDHHHYEYYDSNEWIDKDSEPVVISVR
jgi:hypothetical protein